MCKRSHWTSWPPSLFLHIREHFVSWVFFKVVLKVYCHYGNSTLIMTKQGAKITDTIVVIFSHSSSEVFIYSTYTVTVLWLHFLLVLIMYMYFYPETLTMNSKQWHIRYTATAVFIHFHSLGFLAPFLFEQYWFKLTDISNWRYSIDQNWSMAVSTCSITVKGYPLPTPLSLESYCSIIWIFSLICQFEIWTCTKVWRSYTHLPLLSYSVCKLWILFWKSVLQTAQECKKHVRACVGGKMWYLSLHPWL